MQTLGHAEGWRKTLGSVKASAVLVFALSMALLTPRLGVPKGKVWDEFLYVSGAKSAVSPDSGNVAGGSV